LEKKALTSTITKLTYNNKIVTCQKEVLRDIVKFYKKHFTNKNTKMAASCKTSYKHFLDEADKIYINSELNEDELFLSLLEMHDGKSPGNDGLTCEFYKEF